MKNKKINYGTTFPCQFTKDGKDELERLASACIRIQTHLKAIEKQYYSMFGENKFSYKIRRDFEWVYYLGKLMAYTYVLSHLGDNKSKIIVQKIGLERGTIIGNKGSEAYEVLPYLSRKKKQEWIKYAKKIGFNSVKQLENYCCKLVIK